VPAGTTRSPALSSSWYPVMPASPHSAISGRSRAAGLRTPMTGAASASASDAMASRATAGAGMTLVPELAARRLPRGVRLLPPAEPVTRQIFTVSRLGGDRKPAVCVVLDALAAEAASPRPAAA